MFRTTDGGETWERVLFVGEDTGASDIAMDPANPRRFVSKRNRFTVDLTNANPGDVVDLGDVGGTGRKP